MVEELRRLFAREFHFVSLEWWQQAMLNKWWAGNNIAVNKSRRIGYSFLMAVCAMLKVQNQKGYTHTFISLDREESSNKINMCRDIYYQIPKKLRKPLVKNNEMSLAFLDETQGHRVSVIRSWPAKALRGFKGDVTFDESAFIPKFSQVYDGSLPATLRSDSGAMVLSMGSTPFGNSGRFYEVLTEKDKFKNYVRFRIPWFYSEVLCQDPKQALQGGVWGMNTEERVYCWGVPKLIEMFENYELEAFQQEMECLFVDSAASYITIEEILANTAQGTKFLEPNWLATTEQEQRYSNNIDDFLLSFDDSLLDDGYELYAGMDIGRHRNASELFVGLHLPHQEKRKVYLVGMFTMRNVAFDQQKDTIAKLFGLPIRNLYIDRTGIGEDIAEWATKKFGSHRVTGVQFNIHTKAELASGLKFAFERNNLRLPSNRELQRQIHSVQRKASEVGEFKYEAKNEGDSHADKFWALALMNLAVGFDEQKQGRGVVRDIRKMPPRPKPVISAQQKMLNQIKKIQQQSEQRLLDKFKY